MIDTKEQNKTFREQLFLLHGEYETEMGVQSVKNQDIGYDDGGFEVLKQELAIRDRFLEKVAQLHERFRGFDNAKH